jgi:hypothetical protein
MNSSSSWLELHSAATAAATATTAATTAAASASAAMREGVKGTCSSSTLLADAKKT